MTTVAFIGARGGSKGISNKNLIKILEVSLLERIIDIARRSNCFNRIVVSSDDDTILWEAKQYQYVKVERFRQTKRESGDRALQEKALARYLEENQDVDRIVLLQPTSPLVLPEDIKGGLAILDEGYDSSFGAYREHWLPRWTTDEDEPKPTYNIQNRPQRQKRKEHFVDNGAFYAFTREAFKKTGARHGNLCKPYEMPLKRSFQIDTHDDIDVVKRMLL